MCDDQPNGAADRSDPADTTTVGGTDGGSGADEQGDGAHLLDIEERGDPREGDERPNAAEARERLYAVMRGDDSFETKAERAMAIGRAYLGVENGYLARIDPDGDYWRSIASTDPDDGQFPAGVTSSLAGTYCRRVIDGTASLAIHDAVSQGLRDDPVYQDHGISCYHGTPLYVDDRPYGTLCFVSFDPREEAFTDAETMFAELIARMLEAELLRERTAAQVARLDDFASVVSHDLRNPLNVAQGRIALERERTDSGNLEAAARAIDRMEGLIEDVLTMAREGDTVEEKDLRTVQLSSVVDDCWRAVETGSATVTVGDDVRFRADPSRLARLVENCFRNAVEHGGSDVTIRIGALRADNGFYIEDDGPGIPEDDRDRIFESGFSTGTAGAGLGLSIVKGIVEAHGWRITVTDARDGGARFEVSDVIVIE
ncbi:sensor histidine kinase [Halorubrum vacuolatum]|uniref:histidine kinase n=1 Tax=Halorubrum vacuolatum TaxID=63740 RepID=A0A238ULT7_HALVU|nr:GAF domain-containing sensor histidine kinase [Halorubrum vacuolatum]SNR22931.1 Signal transduction histidine kinase [Halorubrum vacuolatum]